MYFNPNISNFRTFCQYLLLITPHNVWKEILPTDHLKLSPDVCQLLVDPLNFGLLALAVSYVRYEDRLKQKVVKVASLNLIQ